ncbi:hypothetical protein HGA91_02040 [candidate division WWE3 bacterium]|nr:hypothetical protein [candidate division WWE3 bacterium]
MRHRSVSPQDISDQYVKHLILVLRISPAEIDECELIAQWTATRWDQVLEFVRGLGTRKLGLLVASVQEDVSVDDLSLYSVHCETWLAKHASGRELLESIAATMLIARVFGQLRSQTKWARRPRAAA